MRSYLKKGEMAFELLRRVIEKLVFSVSLSLNHDCNAVVLHMKLMVQTHYTETCRGYECCINIQKASTRKGMKL